MAWDGAVTAAYDLGGDLDAAPLTSQVFGAVNDLSGARDVVVCAAGSMTGDLHKMWRTNDAKGYQVEYGYSCMVTRSPGGSGSRWHLPTVRSSSMVGGGSYRMMAQEPVTATQEGIKLVVVIVWNHGFTSIGKLFETVGASHLGTGNRYCGPGGRLDRDILSIDLAANAASLGAQAIRADTLGSSGSAWPRLWRRQAPRWSTSNAS